MKKILLVRNDKLGDFILAYPSFALLKTNMPEAVISVFVPTYTKDLAVACPWIDQVLIDPGLKGGKWASVFALAKIFRQEQFDAIITLFSSTRVGLAARLANIPYRLAPATKFAQIFYNHRLVQRRSRSEKPEFQYNEDVVRHFLEDQRIAINGTAKPPFLRFNEKEVGEKRVQFCKQHQLENKQDLVFIHSGSGGSANNLSIQQYAKLAGSLKSQRGHIIVLTAGPAELENAKALGQKLVGIPHLIYHSTSGLIDFAQHIQFADLFISGSTGPLHIAGALDVPTAAFYPKRRSATALRWQTLNSPPRRLSFSSEAREGSAGILKLDLKKAAHSISKKYLLNP